MEALLDHGVGAAADLLSEVVRVDVRAVRRRELPYLGGLVGLVMIDEGLFGIRCVILLCVIKRVPLVLQLLVVLECCFILLKLARERVLLQVRSTQGAAHIMGCLHPHWLLVELGEKLLHYGLVIVWRVRVILVFCLRLIRNEKVLGRGCRLLCVSVGLEVGVKVLNYHVAIADQGLDMIHDLSVPEARVGRAVHQVCVCSAEEGSRFIAGAWLSGVVPVSLAAGNLALFLPEVQHLGFALNR